MQVYPSLVIVTMIAQVSQLVVFSLCTQEGVDKDGFQKVDSDKTASNLPDVKDVKDPEQPDVAVEKTENPFDALGKDS